MEAKVCNQKGEAVGKIDLPASVFGVRWNGDLVHQVATAMRANQRRGTAKVKDRSEVRGGGRKPWRQKGTGRARHGSIRSPLWRGGGVTFGPVPERNYQKKINSKMRRQALRSVLSRKVSDGEVLFLDELKFPELKTKAAQAVLSQLSRLAGVEGLDYKRGNRALIALPRPAENETLSFRNIPGVRIEETRKLNPLQLLTYRYLILVGPKETIAVLER